MRVCLLFGLKIEGGHGIGGLGMSLVWLALVFLLWDTLASLMLKLSGRNGMFRQGIVVYPIS